MAADLVNVALAMKQLELTGAHVRKLHKDLQVSIGRDFRKDLDSDTLIKLIECFG